jgi:hypothetical protein
MEVSSASSHFMAYPADRSRGSPRFQETIKGRGIDWLERSSVGEG